MQNLLKKVTHLLHTYIRLKIRDKTSQEKYLNLIHLLHLASADEAIAILFLICWDIGRHSQHTNTPLNSRLSLKQLSTATLSL